MIKLENVSVGYRKENVLNNISLSIPKGKLVTVIGANGSGKTTLLKAIVGILPKTNGEIFIEEKSVTDLSRQDIAKKISYLAQGKTTPDMTVEQMVLHGRYPHLSFPRKYSEKDRKIAENSLKQMGISELSQRNMSSLSGGMRQNAYIAMALTQDTDYIMLDEPTTYLDISNQLGLMKTLRTLADSGKGIVAVMHDLPLAFTFSDLVVVINNGKIAGIGTPNELCEKNVIKELFNISLEYDEKTCSYSYLFCKN